MAANYMQHLNRTKVPQTQPLPGTNQVPNKGGGFAWSIDCWARMDRFLILGSEGGSFYASEREMTLEAASSVRECFAENPERTIARILEVSTKGLAPRVDPAIFAIALLSTDPRTMKAVPGICRIGTHLFNYVGAAQQVRGWGNALKKCVARWMVDKDPDSLAYQMLKYQNRLGWRWRDILAKSHAKPQDPGHQALYHWAKTGEVTEGAPRLLQIWKEVQSLPKPGNAIGPKTLKKEEERLCQLIAENNLPREMIPTEWLNSAAVWEALLQHMPLTATIRSLAKMSEVGLIGPNLPACKLVTDKLNQDYIHKSRVHPLAILLAGSVYKEGRGIKGGLTWRPAAPIVEALDDAFLQAFHNVEPTGKRYLIGVDVSGSMSGSKFGQHWPNIAGTHLSPRAAASALAMVLVRTEPWVATCAFSDSFRELELNKRTSLSEAIAMTERLSASNTDCAVPMLYAMKHNIPVDAFVVLTDNETNARSMHPSEALRQYRKASGIDAKLIVVGMVANQFSIADPNDPGMLDVVGFSADVPQVMASFVRASFARS
jgi:60 kDa SS-A/Ro ribonucleoprotein